MPEGDTIFRAASRMNAALAGSKVVRFETVFPRLMSVDLVGRTIERVHAIGKHLLIEFDGGLALRTHMRMSGSWHLYRVGERWQRGRTFMRLMIATDRFEAVGFNVPEANFTRTERDPRLNRIGPDLLGDAFNADEAFRRLRERDEVEIADALLDQQALAGIGNVFKSEILFLRGIHPFTRVGALSDDELRGILATSHELLQANVVDRKREWSTWGGYRRTTHRSDPRASLFVYGRRGSPCRRCQTGIEYVKQGKNARSTYWCPRCQPLR
jgi:endonuclease-8